MSRPACHTIPEQVAELLQVSKASVYRWTREGTLLAYKFGRVVRYKRSDVEAMAEPVVPDDLRNEAEGSHHPTRLPRHRLPGVGALWHGRGGRQHPARPRCYAESWKQLGMPRVGHPETMKVPYVSCASRA